MWEYSHKDNYIDNWFKGFFGVYFYETDSDEYGICEGLTITFLGTNFNFVKESADASAQWKDNYNEDNARVRS